MGDLPIQEQGEEQESNTQAGAPGVPEMSCGVGAGCRDAVPASVPGHQALAPRAGSGWASDIATSDPASQGPGRSQQSQARTPGLWAW